MFQKRNEMLEQFLVDCAEIFVIICKTPVALYEYVNSQSIGVKAFMCTETPHLYELLKKDSIIS